MIKKIRKILMNMLIISLGAAIAACAVECTETVNSAITGESVLERAKLCRTEHFDL